MATQRYKLEFESASSTMTVWDKSLDELLVPNGEEPLLVWMLREVDARGGRLRLESYQEPSGPSDHVTPSNPNGAVRQCERRDLHEPHEYQASFAAYYNVYCPGNAGRTP